MPDKKITELGTATIVDTDLLAVAHDPGGVPATVKATIADVLALLTGGGGLVFLEEHVASGSAALDFTGITSDYDSYLFEVLGLVPVTSSADLQVRMSTNGGSSFDSGSNYPYALQFLPATSGNSMGAIGDSGATAVTIAGSLNTNAAGGASGSVKLYNPNSVTLHKILKFDMEVYHSNTTRYDERGTGWYLNTAAVNALRFMFSTGNISSGRVRMYGLAKV